jgi:myo-inositol catabolism protein IolS
MIVNGAPGSYGRADDAEAIKMLHWAFDQGINFVDTAPAYGFGHSEELIGQAVKDRRDRVLIETKVGEHHVNGQQAWDFSPAFVRRALDESLRRLQTDYVDLYVLHLPMGGGTTVEQALEAIEAARGTGKARVVGASIYDNAMGLELIRSGQCAVIQQAINLLQPEAARELLPIAAEHGVGVVARQALYRGFLTGNVTRDVVFSSEGDRRALMGREEINAIFDRIDRLAYLTAGGRRKLIDAAVLYPLSLPAVASVLSGAITQGELAESVAALDAAPFTVDEIARIGAIHAQEAANRA